MNEETFRRFFEISYNGFALVDEEGKIIAWNRRLEEISGLKREEVRGRFVWDVQFQMASNPLKDESRRERYKALLLKILHTGRAARLNQVLKVMIARPDGATRHVLQSVFCIPTDKGFQLGCTMQDITEQVQMETALRESEERYRELVDLSPEAIILHQDQKFVYVNQAGMKLFGATRAEEIIGKPILDVVHPDYRTIIAERVQSILAGQPTTFVEQKLLRLDGQPFDAEAAGVLITCHGKPAVQGIIRDITARKQSERALEQHRAELQAIFDATTVALYVVDSQNRIRHSNQAARRFGHRAVEDVAGKQIGTVLHCLHYLDVPEGCGFGPCCRTCVVRTTVWETFRSRHPIEEREGMLILKAGEQYVPREVRVGSGFFEGEGEVFVVVALQDITAHKQTEEALRKSENRFRSLYALVRLMVDNMEDMVWAKDMEKRFIFVNKAICEKLLQAKDLDEPIGKTDVFFARRERAAHPEDPQWHSFGEICTNSDSVVMETRQPARFDEFGNVRGQYLHLDVFKSPIWDEQGQMIGTVGVGRDVTREKLLEAERMRMEETLRRRTAQLETLRKAGLEMISHLDLHQLVQSVARSAVELLGGTAGRLCLYNPEQGMLKVAAVTRSDDPFPAGTALDLERSICGLVWQTRKPLLVHDPLEWVGQPTATSAVAVPILWGQGKDSAGFMGAIVVESDTPAAFSAEDTDLLRLFAAHAAIAIRNAQLYTKADKRARQMAVVYNLGQQITPLLDVDKLLQRASDVLQKEFGYLTVQAYLIDSEAGELEARGVAGEGDVVLRGYRQKVGEGVTGRAAEQGERVLVRDVRQEPNFIPCVPGIQSELALPIRSAGQTVGVLNVESGKLDDFDNADVIALEALATQIGTALENARLYEQAREDAETKARLLREVNHRVGNNLTAISGMLALAKEHIRDSDPDSYRATMADLASRVSGLATVHNMLSASGWIPLRLDELVRRIVYNALQVREPDVQIDIQVTPSPVEVTADQAHHLALIINELTINAAKHAVSGRTAARLEITITSDGETVQIRFHDDGPGYLEGVLRGEQRGSGVALIQEITRRNLHGTVELRNDDGAVTVIRFPNEENC